jgi:mannosyltransferase OCH1-like enzyme
MYLTQFWDQRPIPEEIEVLMESYRAQNPDLQHRCFDRVQADDFIARHFSARHLNAFRSCAVPAMQADYLRYCAVLVDGGFYSDADSRCITPVATLLPPGADGVLVQRPNGIVINGFFGFRNPRHPLLGTVLEIATTAIETRAFGDDLWLTSGPGILTFLWVISASTPEEREQLYVEDQPADERTKCIRLCRDIAMRELGAVDGIFTNIHLCPFGDFQSVAQEIRASYKETPRHWVHWEGSIYAGDARAGAAN